MRRPIVRRMLPEAALRVASQTHGSVRTQSQIAGITAEGGTIMRKTMVPSRTVEIYEAGFREGFRKGLQEAQQKNIQKGRDETLAAVVHHMRAHHSLEEIAGLIGVATEKVRAVWQTSDGGGKDSVQ